jgi:xylulokinase
VATVGVDIGTSSVKAIAFADDWSALARGRTPYAVQSSSDGFAELPVDVVLAATEAAVRATVDDCPEPVTAIAFAALGEAIFPQDGHGSPLAGAPLTADRRSRGLSEWWLKHLSADRIKAITQLPLRDVWSASRILWWLRDHPRMHGAGFRCFEDAAVELLGLPPTISTSLAARTMLYEPGRQDWSDELLAVLELDRTQLSAVALPGTPIGELSEGRWGLAAGTLVAAGGHDTYCSAIAVGAEQRAPMWSTGTVDTVAFLSAAPLLEAGSEVLCYEPEPGVWCTPFPNLNGGGSLSWMSRMLGADEGELLPSEVPGWPDRPMVVPLFGTTGLPDFDSNPLSTIVGLRYSDDRSDLATAVMEGVTLETRFALESAGAPLEQVEQLNLAGGGTRSPVWAQHKADVLGKPVTIRREDDAACVGAAMLARQALTGERATAAEANEAVRQVEPTPQGSAQAETRFELYRSLRALALGEGREAWRRAVGVTATGSSGRT